MFPKELCLNCHIVLIMAKNHTNEKQALKQTLRSDCMHTKRAKSHMTIELKYFNFMEENFNFGQFFIISGNFDMRTK